MLRARLGVRRLGEIVDARDGAGAPRMRSAHFEFEFEFEFEST